MAIMMANRSTDKDHINITLHNSVTVARRLVHR